MNFEEIVESLDETTVLTKGVVLDLYRKFGQTSEESVPVEKTVATPTDWRERIWTCPDETQLSVVEFGEAANRKRSWAYEQARKRTAAPVHHDEAGRPYFVASEVRDWLRVRGEIQVVERRNAA